MIRAASATVGACFTCGGEFRAAHRAVVIGVETFEPGVGPFGAARLGGGAHFDAGDGTVAVGVGGSETRDALADELCLADPAVTVGIGPHGVAGSVLRLLGDGHAANCGERQGGEAADQKCLAHGFRLRVRAKRRVFCPPDI